MTDTAPGVTPLLTDDQMSARHGQALDLAREYRSDGWSVRLASGGRWFIATRQGRSEAARTAAGLRALLGQ